MLSAYNGCNNNKKKTAMLTNIAAK